LKRNPDIYKRSRSGRRLNTDTIDLKLQQRDLIFYEWSDHTGKYIFQPLNLRTAFKGIVQSVPIRCTSQSEWEVLTPAVYGFPTTKNSVRTCNILQDPVIYEVEILDQHDTTLKHRIYIREEQIDPELSANLNAIPAEEPDETLAARPWFEDLNEDTSPLTTTLSDHNQTTEQATSNSPLVEPPYLNTSKETDEWIAERGIIDISEDESHLFATSQLNYFYKIQREDPSLKSIFDALDRLSLKEGRPGYVQRWIDMKKEKLQKQQEKSISNRIENDPLHDSNRSQIEQLEADELSSMEKWNGITLIRPEGEYFINNIGGIELLSLIRIDYRGLKINNLEPVIVLPRETGQKLATYYHRDRNHCGTKKLYNIITKRWY